MNEENSLVPTTEGSEAVPDQSSGDVEFVPSSSSSVSQVKKNEVQSPTLIARTVESTSPPPPALSRI